VRVPSFRALLERNLAYLAKDTAKSLVASPEIFAAITEQMRRDGCNVPDGITFDDMREFLLDESRYTVEVEPSSTLGTIVDLVDGLVPALAARRWSLVRAKEGAADFLCTDRPVVLVRTTPGGPPHLGFGQPWTEVSLPLNRRVTAIGHWEGQAVACEADSLHVGRLNHRMYDHAERFVFSAEEQITVTVPRDRPRPR
jgi:hypothetical protein